MREKSVSEKNTEARSLIIASNMPTQKSIGLVRARKSRKRGRRSASEAASASGPTSSPIAGRPLSWATLRSILSKRAAASSRVALRICSAAVALEIVICIRVVMWVS